MRLLVTGAWREADLYVDRLKDMGHEVLFLQYEQDPLPCEKVWVEGVIGGNLFAFHPIEEFLNLRYIQITGAGSDHLPMEAIRQRRIAFHNAGNAYCVPMAETALSAILQICRMSRRHEENQKKHLWEKLRGQDELYGKRALIFGCGNVGTECAKRLQAFGVQTAGINRHGGDRPYFDAVMRMDEFDDSREMKEADIIISALPLTSDTAGYFDRKHLEIMKQNAIFINLSRGGIVQTEDLIDVLKMRRDLSVVLDVFESEPLDAASPLWDMENVLLTPHDSYIGPGNRERLWNVFKENLEEYQAQEG